MSIFIFISTLGDQTVNILDCGHVSSARTSTAAVMVTVKQRRPENAVTRAGAGRGWGEEVNQTTGEGALAILLQSGSL